MQAIRSSDVPLAYQLEGTALITSLPYIDAPIDKDEFRHIKKLIKQELKANEEGSKARPELSFDLLTETPETASLDRLGELLGKRTDPKNGKEVNIEGATKNRGEYEQTVIAVERQKDRLLRLKIMKQNLSAVAAFQLSLNAQLKARLDREMQGLTEKCTQVNELRKFAQVGGSLIAG